MFLGMRDPGDSFVGAALTIPSWHEGQRTRKCGVCMRVCVRVCVYSMSLTAQQYSSVSNTSYKNITRSYRPKISRSNAIPMLKAKMSMYMFPAQLPLVPTRGIPSVVKAKLCLSNPLHRS
jgi:hypothetical protein